MLLPAEDRPAPAATTVERARTSQILIVDDDAAQRRLLTDLMRDEGFDVVSCATAAAALRIVDETVVGVIVLDLRLPDAQGTQLLDRLRARHERIEVVIYTGYGSFDTAKAAVNLGAFAYVEKLSDPAELVRHVHLAFRKRAETALQESEERYRLLAEYSTDLISRHDREGICLYASPACRRMLGFEPEELVGRSAYEFIHPEDVAAIREAHAYVLAHPGVAGATFRILRRDLTYAWFETNSQAIRNERTGAQVIVSVSRDISERKQAEEERRRLEARMQHSQKLESLGVLAGGVAHDFNNLLQVILSNADLVRDRLPPDASARASLAQLELAARRAAELTDLMLAYSGRGRLVVEPVNLSELVQEMTHLLETSINRKIQVERSLPPGLPAVIADPTQIRQVALNLLTNAAESLLGQSGTIRVATGVRTLTPAECAGPFVDSDLSPGNYVFLKVSDDGCGMTDEVRARIFEPFFSTKVTGRGLGLAAVSGIVRGHRGAIHVVSRPGQGTTFEVLLPASSRAAPLGERPPPDPVSEHRESGTVLIVDDEPLILDVTGQILTAAGFSVLKAGGGCAALELARSHAGQVGSVLLDVTMPDMDGAATYQELRRILPEVPIILSSGFNAEDTTRKVELEGIAGFIKKPYRAHELIAALRRILGDAASPESAAGR